MGTKAEEAYLQAVEELKSYEAEASKDIKADTIVEDIDKDSTSTDTPTEEVTKEEKQYTDLEVEQMALGWDPNKEDGVSAKEFKRVGEIIEAKRLASKKAKIADTKVEELTKTVKTLVEQNRAVAEAVRAKTLREIEDRKLAAIDAGDRQAFKLAEAEQAAIAYEAQKQVQASQAVPIPQDIVDFKEQNKDWLNGTSALDIAMTQYVVAQAKKFETENPDIDPKLAIQQIKEGLAEINPSRFGEKTKVSLTSTSTTSGKGKDYSQSRLSYEQKKTYDDIWSADNSYTIEEYVKSLEAAGRL